MAGSPRREIEPDLPKRIGRYEVFRQIGAGGMARVYLGIQHGPFAAKKLVVVKQLRPDALNDDQLLEMFVDEARITLQLNHPNVVHTYEVVAKPPDYYLAMEFLDGQSLMEILRRLGRDKLPLEEHVWILAQVLAGLHYAHQLKSFDGSPLTVVHRDVSPSNVMVCYSGEVKLLDFGIAKATGAITETREGMMKGKLGYAAPEQCLGLPADARSDVYAVGVMLWEAMARRARVAGETWASRVQARLEDAEPAIEQIWPEAPPELIAISRRSLQRDPDRRYATAQAFQRDLEAYLSRCQRKVTPETVGAFLLSHFQAERAELQRAIEQHLGESPPRSSVTPLTGSRPIVGPASPKQAAWTPELEEDAGEDRDTSPVAVDGALLLASKLDVPVEDTGTAMALQPKRRWGLAVVPVALVLLLGGAYIGTRGSSEAAVSPEAPGTTTAPGNPNPTGTASSDLKPTSTQVALRISASPASAVFILDGRELQGNPFSGVVDRDDKDHELVITADGHEEESHVLRFERDIDVKLSLKPETATSKKRPRRLRAARVAPTPARSAPVAAAPSSPPPASTPTPRAIERAPRIEPGADLRTVSPGRTQRAIDDKDPYSQ